MISLRARFQSGRLDRRTRRTLQAWRALDSINCRLYFWRDRYGREVDFVLEKNGALVGLEIKASSQVMPADAAGIRAFQDALATDSPFRRSVILNGGSARQISENIHALPWGWMLPKIP